MFYRLALTGAFTACLAAPIAAQDYPITLTDDRPAEIKLDTKPESIVTLSAASTDMAVAMGIEPAAITTYEGRRPDYLGTRAETAIDLGDLTAPNLELLAEIDADLIVGMLRYNGPYEEELEAVAPLYLHDSGDLAQSDTIVAQLAAAYGDPAAGEAMNAAYDKLIAETRAAAPEDEPSYLFIWHYFDTLYAYQDNLLTAELISSMGARNKAGYNKDVTSAEEAFVIYEPEQLLELDPDVLFVFSSHGGPIKHTPLFDRLSAVQNGRAFSMGYQYSQPSGPIAREMVLREAVHLLWPDTFDAPDIPDKARAVPLEFAR